MLRPVTAWASPEFAYSADKWAALRDDVLEYGELADLVHEYNATVINNRLEYDDYRGKDHDEMKNAYQDIADRLYDSSDKMMDSVNEDQPGYAGTAVGAISARLQAEQNQELADSLSIISVNMTSSLSESVKLSPPKNSVLCQCAESRFVFRLETGCN